MARRRTSSPAFTQARNTVAHGPSNRASSRSSDRPRQNGLLTPLAPLPEPCGVRPCRVPTSTRIVLSRRPIRPVRCPAYPQSYLSAGVNHIRISAVPLLCARPAPPRGELRRERTTTECERRRSRPRSADDRSKRSSYVDAAAAPQQAAQFGEDPVRFGRRATARHARRPYDLLGLSRHRAPCGAPEARRRTRSCRDAGRDRRQDRARDTPRPSGASARATKPGKKIDESRDDFAQYRLSDLRRWRPDACCGVCKPPGAAAETPQGLDPFTKVEYRNFGSYYYDSFERLFGIVGIDAMPGTRMHSNNPLRTFRPSCGRQWWISPYSDVP